MVKLGTWLTLGALGAGIIAFYRLGGASGIGSRIGGGFNSLITGISSGIQAGITGGINPFQQTQDPSGGMDENKLQNIVESQGLDQYVTNVPQGVSSVSNLQKGLLTYAGFLQANKIEGKIDLNSGVFSNKYTNQPLNFTINRTTGGINTGQVGLGAATIAAQQALSAKYGIPTFDVKGNLSAFSPRL